MKYGMRERISGALILIALAVIFVPLLFDDPAPREERPEPTLTIEQPIEVERRDLEEPTPPESLDERAAEQDSTSAGAETETEVNREPVESVTTGGDAENQQAAVNEEPQTSSEDEAASSSRETSDSDAATTGDQDSATEQRDDPIAELARAADERQAAATQGGDWAIQVGSFGESANAERLQARLEEQGYPAYRRSRENDLTTVYVGPYASSEVAEGVMGKLKAGLNLQGLLVRTK
ncbi:SPOR domain-containing protein [Halomonas eurihalina]|uniref:SPOR domain-containing protein n=1 Tax=Halomonas eurihalina TaxID=42566 RepID=A0A5D9DBC4_HALER|nr:SPOR domain-containing protein [Halomonas eurihalina]MDR5858308.1 SPOR domain-containing protein [Halomonas eurihalina]TZG41198.1 SPOR domain-containing protein [Halomonas eurihalina]